MLNWAFTQAQIYPPFAVGVPMLIERVEILGQLYTENTCQNKTKSAVPLSYRNTMAAMACGTNSTASTWQTATYQVSWLRAASLLSHSAGISQAGLTPRPSKAELTAAWNQCFRTALAPLLTAVILYSASPRNGEGPSPQ